jgi:thiol:disulfide interchange protein DsbC
MNLLHLGRLGLLTVSLALAATTASCAPPQQDKAAKKKQPAAKVAPAAATPAAPGPALDADKLKEKLHAMMPDLQLEAVRPSVIPGLFEVQRGALFDYVTADGRFLISGDLINLETGEEITEASRKQMRLDAIAELGDQYIAFDPPKGKAENTVTVFVDVDCGYCRKLHDELPSYQALGIGFHYVFFPRAGLGSDSERQLDAAWCSPDRKTAITKAIHGEKFKTDACETPTKKHYELAAKLGVRGTPLMVLPTGDVVNGYVPAERLAERLVAASLPPAPPGGATAAPAPKSAP